MSELPKGWLQTALSDVAAVEMGQSPDSSSYNSAGKGLPFFQGKAEFQAVIPEIRKWCSDPTKVVEGGDILLSVRAPVGPTNLAPEKSCIGRGLAGIRAENGVSQSYLFYFFRSIEPWLSEQGTGSTFAAVSGQFVRGIAVPIGPTREQTRIVAKLEELLPDLDAGVAELKAAQKKLQLYRQSLLKAAVEGALTADWREAQRRQGTPTETGAQLLARIRTERRARWEAKQLAKFKEQGKAPPKDWQRIYQEPEGLTSSEIRNIPAGWCMATPTLVGVVLLGRQRAPQFLTGRWPKKYLRVANIKDDWIDFSDIESMDFDEAHFDKYRLLPGDILVSEGQSPELVGQSAIFRGYHEPLCFQKTLHRFRAVPGTVLSEYAQFVFQANVYTGVFRAIASITTNIAHLTLEKFEASPFALPPLAEQAEIVSILNSRLSRVEEMELDIEKGFKLSKAQRQNVLRAAFSGALVPQGEDDEPASLLLERIRVERAKRATQVKPARSNKYAEA